MGRASPFHEAHGDYRTEIFIEGPPTPPLYQLQNSLPRLPVPTLEETFARYLASVAAVAKSPEEYERSVAAARVFLQRGGLVRKSSEGRLGGKLCFVCCCRSVRFRELQFQAEIGLDFVMDISNNNKNLYKCRNLVNKS